MRSAKIDSEHDHDARDDRYNDIDILNLLSIAEAVFIEVVARPLPPTSVELDDEEDAPPPPTLVPPLAPELVSRSRSAGIESARGARGRGPRPSAALHHILVVGW